MIRRLLQCLTPTGKFVACAAALGGVLGLGLGWSEFLTLSIACVAALVAGSLWVLRPVQLGVHRTLHPTRISVGGASLGIIQVTNSTTRPIGHRIAHDQIGENTVQLAIPSLAAGAAHEMPYSVQGRHRGLIHVGPVTLVRSDPLHLFRAVDSQGSTEQLFVHPRTYPLVAGDSALDRTREGRTSDSAPRGSAAFHALREYQRGDELRHVHWRTSARMNRLMVRHFVDVQHPGDALVLDTRSSSYESSDFEHAVEIAASLALALEKSGNVVALVLGGEALHHRSLPPMDRLTLVQPVVGLTTGDLFGADGGPRATGGLVVITGDVGVGDLVTQSRIAARGRSVVVVRCVPAISAATSFELRGCTVIDTPSAEALAGQWRATAGRR